VSDHRPEAGSRPPVKDRVDVSSPERAGLSAWELACHASLTGAPQVSRHLRLPVSGRRIPVPTPLSGTQRARPPSPGLSPARRRNRREAAAVAFPAAAVRLSGAARQVSGGSAVRPAAFRNRRHSIRDITAGRALVYGRAGRADDIRARPLAPLALGHRGDYPASGRSGTRVICLVLDAGVSS